tara:strand:- start:123 stop:599 length:477 start_codon:yes stop_codon:yes gene_type:complete
MNLEFFAAYGTELFAICFGIAAVTTRKDLAWYCFGASILSLVTHYSGLVYESKIISYSFITLMVALGSAAHYKLAKFPLSLAVCVICCLTLLNHASQVIGWTDASLWISYGLGVSMLLSLIFMKGSKGILNDLANDINSSIDYWILNNRNNSNGKGRS